MIKKYPLVGFFAKFKLEEIAWKEEKKVRKYDRIDLSVSTK